MPNHFDISRKSQYLEQTAYRNLVDFRRLLTPVAEKHTLTGIEGLEFDAFYKAYMQVINYAASVRGQNVKEKVTAEQAEQAWQYLTENAEAQYEKARSLIPGAQGDVQKSAAMATYEMALNNVTTSVRYVERHEEALEGYVPEEEPVHFDADALRPLADELDRNGSLDYMRTMTDEKGVPCSYWMEQVLTYVQAPPADLSTAEARAQYDRADAAWKKVCNMVADKRREVEAGMESMKPDTAEYRKAIEQLNVVSGLDNTLQYVNENAAGSTIRDGYTQGMALTRSAVSTFLACNSIVKSHRINDDSLSVVEDDDFGEPDMLYPVEILNDDSTTCPYYFAKEHAFYAKGNADLGPFEQQLAKLDHEIAKLKKQLPAEKPAELKNVHSIKEMDEIWYKARHAYIQEGRKMFDSLPNTDLNRRHLKQTVENDLPSGKRYHEIDGYCRLGLLEMNRAALIHQNKPLFNEATAARLDKLASARRERLEGRLSFHLNKLSGMTRLVSDSDEYKLFRDSLESATRGGSLDTLKTAVDRYIDEKTKNNKAPSTEVGKSRLTEARIIRDLVQQELSLRKKSGPAVTMPEDPTKPRRTEADTLIDKAVETLGAAKVTEGLRKNIRAMYQNDLAAHDKIAASCTDLKATVELGAEASAIVSYQALKASIMSGKLDASKAEFFGRDNIADACRKVMDTDEHLKYIDRPHTAEFFAKEVMVNNQTAAHADRFNAALDMLQARAERRAAIEGVEQPVRRSQSVHLPAGKRPEEAQAGDDKQENPERRGSFNMKL